MATAAVLVVVGYALGSLPIAAVVARRAGHDPSIEGSGNPGATNVFRTAGRRAGALVAAGDIAKGAVAAGLGWAVGDHTLGAVVGLAAVAGHVFPLGRRGGKGVATAGGAVVALWPLHGLVAAVLWFVVFFIGGRRASLASLVVVGALPVGIAATGAPAVELGVLAAMAAVVVVRHAGNIRRLLAGTESTLEVGHR